MTKHWIPRLCFHLNLIVAIVLLLLVFAASWLDNRISSRWLTVFAHDKTLRRTAVASALGLVVTAYVFFRPAARRARSRDQRLPPPPIAGA